MEILQATAEIGGEAVVATPEAVVVTPVGNYGVVDYVVATNKNEVTNKNEKFRIYAKKFLLTYSQVPEDLTPDEVIEQLGYKIHFVNYVVGTEYHQDGGKHFHVVLISDKRQDFRSPKTFEIEFQGKVYTCNCQGIRNLPAAIRYATKQGSYITSFCHGEDGPMYNVRDIVQHIADTKGIEEALRYYIKNQPREAMGGKGLLNMERYLRRVEELSRGDIFALKTALDTPFRVEDFQPLKMIEKWRENGFRPTLVLVGPGGCGKTQFVKALAKENGWKMLIVNHKEGLKDLTVKHDAVFFDDLVVDSFNAQEWLALLEGDDQRTIRLLYSSIRKRGGLAQILAFNKTAFSRIKKNFKRTEILRRCHVVPIPPNFIINQNITNNNNILINPKIIHQHIYNNPETIEANRQALIDIENSPD